MPGLTHLPHPTKMGKERGWRKGVEALAFLKTLLRSCIDTTKADQSKSSLLFYQQKDLLNYKPPKASEGRVSGGVGEGGPEPTPWLLILDFSGQTPEEATSISLADSTTVNIHALTQTPGEERGTGLVRSCHCK